MTDQVSFSTHHHCRTCGPDSHTCEHCGFEGAWNSIEGWSGPGPGGSCGGCVEKVTATIAKMHERLAEIGPTPRLRLHVGETVWHWLRTSYPEARQPDIVGYYLGIDIIVEPTWDPGRWHLREDGVATKAGTLDPRRGLIETEGASGA